MSRENRYIPQASTPNGGDRANRYNPISSAEPTTSLGVTPQPTRTEPIMSVAPKQAPMMSMAPRQEPIMSVAPKPVAKQEPSFWNKAAKAILPKAAEDYFGLNGQEGNPTGEVIKSVAKGFLTPNSPATTVLSAIGNPLGGVFKTKKLIEPATISLLNHPAVQPVMKQVNEKTVGTGIVSAIQAIGPKTFDEAYKANRAYQAGDPSGWNQLMYQLGDAMPQVCVGVALNFVPFAGKPLSLAYWTALSADEQIQNKGKVESLNPIVIDVVLDNVLGTAIKGMFKAPAEVLKTYLLQVFHIEGGTEVAQDLLKYGDAFARAKTAQEKNKILQDTKNYFTSGQIWRTYLVGGLSSIAVGGGAYMINKAQSGGKPQIQGDMGSQTQIEDNLTLKPQLITDRLRDAAGQIDDVITGKRGFDSTKPITPLAQQVFNLKLENIDSPGKFFIEVATVVNADTTIDAATKAKILGTWIEGSNPTGLMTTVNDMFTDLKETNRKGMGNFNLDREGPLSPYTQTNENQPTTQLQAIPPEQTPMASMFAQPQQNTILDQATKNINPVLPDEGIGTGERTVYDIAAPTTVRNNTQDNEPITVGLDNISRGFSLNSKLEEKEYSAFNKAYLALQDKLNIDEGLIESLPKNITGKEAIDFINNSGILGQEINSIEQIVSELKKLGYNNFINTDVALKDQIRKQKTISEAIAQKGPGHQKFNNYVDSMVQKGTAFPEEAIVYKTLFENTNDNLLGNITFAQNGRYSSVQGSYNPRLNRIQIQEGLAQQGKPSIQTFLHEFGHAGWHTVLTESERNIVRDIYNGKTKLEQRALFMGHNDNYKYYAKNEREFFAQSFSDYVMENKVPAAQMEPLLKKVARRFFEGLKKLVSRGESKAVNLMRPLYEKILAGDATTPLTEFSNSEPPSFKADIQRMLDAGLAPETTSQQATALLFAGTKQVPTETLMPAEPVAPRTDTTDTFTQSLFGTEPTGSPLDSAEKTYQSVIESLPPDISSTIEPPQVVLAGTKRTPVSKKIGMLEKISTPWIVFRQLGVFKEYRKLIRAYESYLKELPGNMKKIRDWAKLVSKESNERIFRFLDGEVIQLNLVETKVATEIKAWLAQWADRLGMSPDARISDYITHIFPRGKGGEIPEEIATLIRDKTAKSIYNPFQLPRTGAEGYRKDTWAALEAYVKRATRKVNIDPALQEFNEATAHLTEESQVEYIEKRISTLNMRPTRMETDIDNSIKKIFPNIGPRATLRFLTDFRKMISRSKIAGSIVTLGKNLTQGINTWAELGNKYTAIGYIKIAKLGGKELYDNAVLRDTIYENDEWSAIKKWAEKFDRALFFNMEASEFINRGAAYYGAKTKFLDGKITAKEFERAFGKERPANYTITEEDAIEYGKFIAEKTQFLFGPLETPHYVSGPISKSLFQFSTYGIKQTELQIQHLRDREIKKFLRQIIGSMLFFQFIAGGLGMKWDDSWKTFKWGRPPILKFVQDLWLTLVTGKDKYGTYLTDEEKVSAVGKTLLTNVVPAGAQIDRSVEGFRTVNEGGERTESGKLKYKVDETPRNYVKGTLFGKYNLSESKDYYDKLDKKKKDAVDKKEGKAGSNSRENRYMTQ